MRNAALLFAILALLSSHRANADLLRNGSFEKGELSDPTGMTLAAGSKTIDGWVVGGRGVDWIGRYWQASEGGRSIDLDSGDVLGDGPYDGSISQTFATTVGRKYLVTFDLAGNPDSEPDIKPVQVSAAGRVELFRFYNSRKQTHERMGYKSRTFKFTATASSTTLTFTSLAGTGAGAVIDNVVVSLIP